jgi:hypothetical protein
MSRRLAILLLTFAIIGGLTVYVLAQGIGTATIGPSNRVIIGAGTGPSGVGTSGIGGGSIGPVVSGGPSGTVVACGNGSLDFSLSTGCDVIWYAMGIP